MDISETLFDHIKSNLNEDFLSEPILYTLGVKIAGGSLASHGVDCYELGKLSILPESQLLNIAAATELAWIIILMYDDILDNDTVRYGEDTSWVKFGKERTQESIAHGMRVATMLHPNKDAFSQMYQDCIDAMNNVKKLLISSKTVKVERAYKGYTFGCYDYLLPFDNDTKQLLAAIGYKEMLIAQLINDYKDTCGSRRKQRNYPELREKQANYIIALYNDLPNNNAVVQVNKLIAKANSTRDYEKIAQLLKTNESSIDTKITQLTNLINRDVGSLMSPDLKAHMENLMDDLLKSFQVAIQLEFQAT